MPLVQDLVNDPEIICNFIVNSPQMREYVNLNPELPQIFNDPAIFLQTWEAARNELMHETIRTIQWSLSHTESSLEEFNMLRHMYENVQEPFLNATSMAGDTRNDSGTNPFVALLGAQEQGRNWSTNPPATGSDTTAYPPAPNLNPFSDPWASADFGGAQMNTAPRSNASRNIWGPSPGCLDDVAYLQRMLGGIPGASSENQLIGYPSTSQIMQHINQEYLVQQGLFPYLDQPHSNQSLDYIGFFDSEETLIAVVELEEDSGE
ncbi:ubiquitin domain-containing protein DSK2b-like [Solanum lycopersicum]|uniref:ubiquitin domain-containing protein DSK2b-like n=1 Tax=Solanum lycopersicum TaxID=4081 RepID=UPI00374796D3